MRGKTELKLGQIGKVTILSDTKLVKIASNGSLSTVRTLKKGEEYRVYSYKSTHGGIWHRWRKFRSEEHQGKL